MSEVGPRPKRPLNAKPRIAARQGQGVSGRIRILRREPRRGIVAASGQRRNWPRPDYRHCCPHDSPRMSATHVRGRPKPKRPLNAKPRIAARQGQGTAARSASSGAGQDAEASPQAAGRQDDRTTELLLAGQPRNGRHPCKRSAKCQRGSLTQSLASPRGKARGQRQGPASSSGSQDAEASLQAAAPGLPALVFA